jgi:hypothetical protein
LRREIAEEGGEATVAAATFVAGQTDAELASLFRAERDAEYVEIARAARAAISASGSSPADARTEATRLRRRLTDATRTDFFGAAGRADAEAAIEELEAFGSQRSGAAAAGPAAPAGAARDRVDVRGRTWVTREGVFVDRIGSAWLIRRFIDPDATFKFVAGRSYRPRVGELRFDMYHGEFTHEGERCTFETLLARFGLGDDPALVAIGEIVHDIDLKDEKFGRVEAAGVEAVLAGIGRAHADDADRIGLGSAVFDGLYAQLGGGPRASS